MDTPCWLWTAGLDSHGYGGFWDGTRRTGGSPRAAKAHLWLWEQENGPVPDGLELDHLCMVKLCIRGLHLEVVTHVENMRRAGTAGVMTRPTPETCPQGHPYDTVNTYIRPDGTGVGCKTCIRTRSRAYAQKVKV